MIWWQLSGSLLDEEENCIMQTSKSRTYSSIKKSSQKRWEGKRRETVHVNRCCWYRFSVWAIITTYKRLHIKEIVESTHKQFKMSPGSNDEARHNNFTAHRLTLVTYGFITGFAFLSLQEKMCSTHISHTKKVRLGSCWHAVKFTSDCSKGEGLLSYSIKALWIQV